jgi:triphosphoribosyl-dephospho-CoA synthase
MATDHDHIVSVNAQHACLWEVTARKPGNVHRYRDFDDTTFLDFAVSAAVIAPYLAIAYALPVGEVIRWCAVCTHLFVGKNTNLGIILLLAPLAKARGNRAEVECVLSELSVEDAKWAYEGIRRMTPGGLGTAAEQDVRSEPTVTLREAMALAAHRDMVARQYVNGFREVFDEGVPAYAHGLERTGCVEGGIIHAHLHLMSRFPDTLIARKCGGDTARESAARAARVLDLGWPVTEAGRREIVELDDWLRADGHRRNPGTTADLIAASLFVWLMGHMTTSLPWPLAEGAP